MTAHAPTWNPRGSEWNRWDPHIHAPGTVNNDQFKGDWPGYIAAIDNSSPPIRALGITDYYSLATYREIRRRKAAGEMPKVAFIFPNVEMRLDVKTAKGKGINLHLLFSPEDPRHEEQIERILRQLTFEYNGANYACARNDLIDLGRQFLGSRADDDTAFAEGVQQFKVDFSQLRKVFRSETWLHDNCLVATAAGPNDGLSGLQGDDAFKARREEMQRASHIIFSGNPGDRNYWLGQTDATPRDEIERKYGGLKPCLHGSDAHEVAKVGVPAEKRHCWIKGDLAFESLRHAIIEPATRVFIGEHIPQGPSPSVTLDAIKPVGMPWLGNPEIPINDGITAIIGARGSGKTALADMIACGANALVAPLADSSFLKRATDKTDLIGAAKIEEHWRDGNRVTADFRPPSEFDFDPAPASVRYLSQQFVDRLCSASGLASELRAEIERVIFEQTDPVHRFECDTFASMAAIQLDPIRHRRQQHVDALRSFVLKIAEEQRLNSQVAKMETDRETLRVALEKQRKDLEALLPKGKEERAKQLLALETTCAAIEGKAESLRKRIGALDHLLAEANHLEVYTEPDRFQAMREQFADANLTESQWAEFKMTFAGDPKKVIAASKTAAEKERQGLVDGDPANPVDAQNTPPDQWPLTIVRSARDKLKTEVGIDKERTKKYEAVKKAIAASDAALKKADAAIKHAQGASARREEHMTSRRECYRAIFATFDEEQSVLARLYEPLHDELKSATGSLAKLRFAVRRHIDLNSWVTMGEKLLDLRRDSPFRGQGALAEAAKKTLWDAWSSGDAATVADAVQKFVADHGTGLVQAMPAALTPEAKTDWLRDVGQWVFSTSHVSIRYGLEYDGTNVEQLSPGTRGIVLLLLYLAVDRSDLRPLLIDQPEENLDPRSVFQDLVPHFRDARSRRQIIIVTHNANLVVNTDADQVIVASSKPNPAGGLPLITYQSGSLENPDIRHAVCDILEGGKRAFHERQRRYRLQWEQALE